MVRYFVFGEENYEIVKIQGEYLGCHEGISGPYQTNWKALSEGMLNRESMRANKKTDIKGNLNLSGVRKTTTQDKQLDKKQGDNEEEERIDEKIWLMEVVAGIAALNIDRAKVYNSR
ncbi:hypothetical protein BY996DRAFT_6536336 [Phakopsora pachyrhizi]|nr:hypothetical protein BY996DRAFT_6536336 [Phakopsora pachyrhizi]